MMNSLASGGGVDAIARNLMVNSSGSPSSSLIVVSSTTSSSANNNNNNLLLKSGIGGDTGQSGVGDQASPSGTSSSDACSASPIDQKPSVLGWGGATATALLATGEAMDTMQSIPGLFQMNGSGGGAPLAIPSSGISTAAADSVASASGLSEQDATSTGGDAEGVWSADIEQAFLEALAIYPPCGRRKIILSDEGKMYGRNELIARYIKIRTGKTRTRKQVSSHIQVLARKKQREIHSKIKDHNSKDRASSLQALGNMSSAQIVSIPMISKPLPAHAPFYSTVPSFWSATPGAQSVIASCTSADSPFASPYPHVTAATVNSQQQFAASLGLLPNALLSSAAARLPLLPPSSASAADPGPSSSTAGLQIDISGPKLKLCELVAYVDNSDDEPQSRHRLAVVDAASCRAEPDPIEITLISDKFPQGRDGLRDLYEKGPRDAFYLVKFWGDISFSVPDETAAFYAVDSRYESSDSMAITVSTKVCSFGKQVVEKVETEYALFDQTAGRFAYRINKSPMCEYMVKFIHQLRKLSDPTLQNSVLDNFTALQLVTNKETRETLLCVAFVFAVGLPPGVDDIAAGVLSSKVYRLTGCENPATAQVTSDVAR